MGAGRRIYEWTPESIRWYINASGVSDYHSELAKCVAGYLRRTDRICDMGCGLGYLSQELTKLVTSVDAFDIRQQAVDELEARAEAAGTKNLRAFIHDFSKGPSAEMDYDAAVMSLFGVGERDVATALRYAKGHVIFVINASEKHKFAASEAERIPRVLEVRRALEAAGCTVNEQRLSLEFGQPFTDMADAEAFMNFYSSDGDEDIKRFLSESLVPFERDGFSLYLPVRKELGIISAHYCF